MPMTAYNERTTDTHPCRVEPNRYERFEGVPREIMVPRWRVVQPWDTTDLAVGDALDVYDATAALVGVYVIMTLNEPRAYQVDVKAETLKVDYGTYRLPLTPNLWTTITSSETDEHVTNVPVFLEPMPMDGTLGASAVKYQYIVHLPPNLTYPGGTQVSGGDTIDYDRFPGGQGTLRELRHQPPPLERIVAYIDTTG